MQNAKLVERDERTESIENRSYSLGYKVIAYAVLLDIMYRSFRFREASWDLFVIVILSGAVVTGYQFRHQVLGKSWTRIAVLAIGIAAVLALVAALFVAGR